MQYKHAHQQLLRAREAEDGTLKITVVYTSEKATLLAMQKAVALASSLPAKLRLVYPQIVPYPCPVASPPVLPEFTAKRLRQMASHVALDTDIHVCLCRDREDALRAELLPRSVVVLGGRKRWWPTAEKGLARKLRRAGHEVIFTETE